LTSLLRGEMGSFGSLFLFAQRSWQTRQVERNLSHPDCGEENPNRKGVAGQRQGLKEAIGS
ncbi:MAG: hypothetical protein KKB49_12880, partial [Gammaproteobacteria bacterium]|nr:hypothetical protein [Gammaproteobacteria bacterium]